MKYILLILAFLIFSFPSYGGESDDIENVSLVIIGNVLNTGEGSKYIYQSVEVLEILRNDDKVAVPNKITTALYSWADGMAIGKLKIYLSTYYKQGPHMWLVKRFEKIE